MNQFKAYFSLIKPERTFTNVMMTGAGFLFASRWHLDWSLLVATIVGTTLIVMSACAVNNAIDQPLDKQMPRTQKRPTVTGMVPVRNIAILGSVLGVAGFAVLIAYVNWPTVLLGVIGYIDYVVLYGWSKRTTVHSTLIGTLSGSVTIMAGYVAVRHSIDITAILLGITMLFWQMPHFYAIGIFRHDDYKVAHLPIWPVQRGIRSAQLWSLYYIGLYVVSALGLRVFGAAGVTSTVLVAAAGLWWLYKGIRGLEILEPVRWGRKMFGLSMYMILLFAAAVAVDPLLP